MRKIEAYNPRISSPSSSYRPLISSKIYYSIKPFFVNIIKVQKSEKLKYCVSYYLSGMSIDVLECS